MIDPTEVSDPSLAILDSFREAGEFMRFLSIIIWIVIALLIIIFAALNSYTVTLHYYVNSVNVYFPLLLIIAVALGVILGVFIMLPHIYREKKTSRTLKRQVKQFEQKKG